MGKIINGILVSQFAKGWWGVNGEGEELLNKLGLEGDTIPFSVENYLSTGRLSLRTINGVAEVTVTKHDAHFDFSCKWPNKTLSFKLYREWDGTDLGEIIKMESYSVGECTRKVLTSKSVL